MNAFKGVFTALITPFEDDLTLDVKALARLANWQVENGVSGIVVSGTTGEAPNLTDDEFIEIIQTVKRYTKGNIPVIAGVGSNSTEKTIKQAKLAEKSGADALMVVAPYYNKPMQQGLIEHFKLISISTHLPIIVYNIPGRSVINMEISTITALLNFRNIVAIKESTANILRFTELCDLSDRLSVLCGDDLMALPARALGAQGVVSVISNFLPDLVVQMHNACDRGNFDEAKKIHNNLYRLTQLMFIETNPIPTKYAMSLLSLCKNNLRLPLTPLSEEHKSKVEYELRSFYDF
ncbi:MAG: 4-hydroxy-tetrahydrodipicolinate synthase [Sphingobacteriia bacterium]|nr:4-hydroxy-tetrahydrodipicolinate synthase [Sphingobacteriia bacterium]